MFFHNKIRSIRPGDRVLEIGPGSTPHPRADVFLEYQFNDEAEKIRQRGDLERIPDYQGRQVVYYTGDKFPFNDGEFDYVIASHVLEHVPSPEIFMSEIYRVGNNCGYVEFPLPSYDFLFDFDVHSQLVWFDERERVINFLKKEKTALSQFLPITSQFRKSLELGWDQIVAENLDYFFVGIEFNEPIQVKEQKDLSQYSFEWVRNGNTPLKKITRKFSRWLATFN